MTQTTPRKSANKLSMLETIKVADMLRSRWSDIEQKKPSLIDFAREMTISLQFPVTDRNLQGMLDQLKLEWPDSRRRTSGGDTREAYKQRAYAVALVLDELGKIMGDLANEIGSSATTDALLKLAESAAWDRAVESVLSRREESNSDATNPRKAEAP